MPKLKKNNRSEMSKYLAHALKTKRIERGLSQQEAGEQSGVSPSTFSRIERGLNQPDVEIAAKLAQWLNIPLEQILHCSNEERPLNLFNDTPLPDVVSACLAKDPNVSPENAEKLNEIFRAAYNQFSRFDVMAPAADEV